MSGYKRPAGLGKDSPIVTLILIIISIGACIFFTFLWNLTVLS